MNNNLLDNLKSIDFSSAAFGSQFIPKLMRENRWSRSYTELVIAEYKRFLYLSQVTEHPVSPSYAVDQVWHLHLCYTDHYWNTLCQKVLQAPLHHGPSKGGVKENHKYEGMYRQTLASYRAHFGEDPPEDVWPTLEQRSPTFVRVDQNSHFIIPKRALLVASGVGVISLALSSCMGFVEDTISGEMVILVLFGVFLLLISVAANRSSKSHQFSRRRSSRSHHHHDGGYTHFDNDHHDSFGSCSTGDSGGCGGGCGSE